MSQVHCCLGVFSSMYPCCNLCLLELSVFSFQRFERSVQIVVYVFVLFGVTTKTFMTGSRDSTIGGGGVEGG